MGTPSTSLPDDATVEARADLRSDGFAALTRDRLYVIRDDERIRVDLADVHEVVYTDYDYSIALMSLVLVGFGIWFARRNPLALLFSVAGLGSLVLVYRKRDELSLRVEGRAKPLTVYPTDGKSFYARLAESAQSVEPDTAAPDSEG